jgi:hypothetical protein
MVAREIDGQQWAPGFAGLRSVLFGYGDEPEDTERYYARPASLGELLDAVTQRDLSNAPPRDLYGILVRLFRPIRHPIIEARLFWRRLVRFLTRRSRRR